jgi:hypothetical protein
MWGKNNKVGVWIKAGVLAGRRKEDWKFPGLVCKEAGSEHIRSSYNRTL